MDFELDDEMNFTSLLHQGTEVPVENCNSKKVSKKVSAAKELNSAEKRGKNFDEEEVKLLVSAWLNTSLDPINGNNIKGDRFWGRIEKYYMEGKAEDWQLRTRSSLTHRWGVIKKAINKFCGFLNQVEDLQRSGANNEDNGPFRFDHCWDLLKDEEKWRKRENASGIKRKAPESSPNESPEAVTVDENDGPSGNQRPIGRKLAKENKKQAKSIRTEVSAGFASVLTEFKDEKQKHHAEKIEKINIANEKKTEFLQIQKSQLLQAEEANRVQNEKLKLEQDREDASIMMMDVSSMDPQQAEYF
ncbi:hypothetical protein OROHE_015767 [Orobanche hederae]